MNRLIVIVLLVCSPVTVFAFYDWDTDTGSGNVRGLVRVYGQALDYPDTIPLSDDTGLAELTRLIIEGEVGSDLAYEVNLYQTHIPWSLASTDLSRRDVERSARLEWSFSDEDFSRVAFDRLNLRASWDRLDVTVGRQAINLATTFYFTPNDFFAPFAAQSFFRVYKPGVDAVRAEIRLGDLSQLSLVQVLGFAPDNTTDTNWGRGADSQRDSFVARISTVFRDVEWKLLAGHIGEIDIIGGSLQGDLFEWLGIRAEGHIADPVTGDQYSEVSVGLEHSRESSLDLRVEYFHHGSGVSRVSDYSALFASTQNSYLARNYVAASAGYEFTPLLTGNALLIKNLLDQSWLLSLYAVYSLSDEAELAINLSLPAGDEPVGTTINSEFGSSPAALNIEVRSNF